MSITIPVEPTKRELLLMTRMLSLSISPPLLHTSFHDIESSLGSSDFCNLLRTKLIDFPKKKIIYTSTVITLMISYLRLLTS